MINFNKRLRIILPAVLLLLALLAIVGIVMRVNPVSAATLHPVFIQVHFDGNGGTLTSPHTGSAWVIKGNGVNLAGRPTYEIVGLQFLGWSNVRIPHGQDIPDTAKLSRIQNGHYLTGAAIASDSYEIAPYVWQAVTRYAVWGVAYFDSIFELNGGTLTDGNLRQSIRFGTRPLAPTAIRDGYILYAWEFSLGAGNTEQVVVPQFLPFQPNYARVFRAVWYAQGAVEELPDGSRQFRRPVYCYSGQRLFFFPALGNMVVNALGRPALTHDGELMTYNEDTGELSDERRRHIDLVARTIAGARRYVINYRRYNMVMVNQNDVLFKIGLRPNTSHNPYSFIRHILLTRTRRTGLWYDGLAFLGNPQYDYSDIWGTVIPTRYLTNPDPTLPIPSNILFAKHYALQAAIGVTLLAWRLPPWGTVRDLMREIVRIEDEYGIALDVPGSIRSDRRYDLGGRIRVESDTGQLMCTVNSPLICNLARPLIRDNAGNYIDFFGNTLTIATTDGQQYVLDQSGEFIRAAARTALEDNYTLVFPWLENSKGVWLQVPAKARIMSVNPFVYRVYDLNGYRLCDTPEFRPPEDNSSMENSARERYPELFVGANWWNQLPPWLFTPLDNLRLWVGLPDSGIGWIGTVALGLGIGIVAFIIALILLAIIIAVIVGIIILLSAVAPAIAPMLPMLGSALVSLLQLLGSGFVSIVTAPVALISGSSKSKRSMYPRNRQHKHKRHHY